MTNAQFNNSLAEFLDSIKVRSIRLIERAGVKNDAEDCYHDAASLFHQCLVRRELRTPGIDPYRWEGLWWRILRQRLAHYLAEIGARREQPLITINEDGKEQIVDYRPGCERDRPQEQSLIVGENERILAEFLRRAATQRGGKAVRALVRSAAAQGAQSAAEVVNFIEGYLFRTAVEWEGRRRDLTIIVAKLAGCSRQALFASLNRVKAWWWQLKSEVLNPS